MAVFGRKPEVLFNSPFLSFLTEKNIRTDNRAAAIIDAIPLPKFNPPFESGFVKKSPNVAPNGRVNMKAIQNNNISFILE